MAETLSWRLAAVSTIEMGAPRPSTRRFIFAPSLPRSVGLLPVFCPPKGAAQCLESMACHFQEIPPCSLAKYWAILFMSFSKMPILLHLWKRSWTTLEETPNQSRWMAFHWHPVQSTYQMALMTARSEALGLPPFALFLLFWAGIS